MPGFVINKVASLTCPHSAPASPNQTNVHVSVLGQPIVTLTHTYKITGCGQNTPCSTGTWMKGAERVKAGGLAVAISTGTSQCVPPGPFTVLFTQQRVRAT